MRIIISPAKQMVEDNDSLLPETVPVFLDSAKEIAEYMKGLSYLEAKKLWACNDKIAAENFERFKDMNLDRNLTPAILSYDGIAFKYMAPAVFETGQFQYIQNHLRILSGFYGVLKPMDGVTPYRLEMQAKAGIGSTKDLYDYWKDSLYKEVQSGNDDRVILNLASKEYSKSIEKYLETGDLFVTCIFGEYSGDKIVQKGVYAKMARGEMVRYMAEICAVKPEDIKSFNHLGYTFMPDLSDDSTYTFIR